MKYTAVVAVVVWSAVACSSGGQALQPGDTFSSQAARLVSTIRITREELAAVPRIVNDLKLALSTRWPDCELKLFGSLVTGLALVGSDIDVYVMLPDRGLKPDKAIHFKAVSVLKRFPDYANIHPRILLITFQHVPTQTKIDLLFNNFEGGRNSALLRYFLSLDDRIWNLAMIIKYWWVKTQNAVEMKVIPNYGMSCMVVFYLQQIDMLPSLMTLQKNAELIEFEGWNTGFDEIDYKPRNNDTLYELLGGFFEFYNDFDFENYIISPFVGYPVERSMFKSLLSVPREFECYHRIVSEGIDEPADLSAAVLIQDPMLHNKNLAENMLGARESYPLMSELKRIALKYREINENAFLDEILAVQFT